MKQKNLLCMMGILSLTLVFGFVLVGCGGDSSGNTESISYSSGDYELIISADSRAAYSPQDGDSYTLNRGGARKSSGRVSISGTTFTFTPTSGRSSFTAVLESESLANITPVTLDDNTTIILPPLNSKKLQADDTGTQIAGCAYTRKQAFPPRSPNTMTVTHYLLSGTYTEALTQLTSQWGSPSEPNALINMFWDGTTDAAKHGRGALLETFRDSDSGENIYRLLNWTPPSGSTQGRWTGKGWSNPSTPALTETSIGGRTFIQKEVFTGTGGGNTGMLYVLSIPYNTALTRLKALWGEPMDSLDSHAEAISPQPNEVIFQIQKQKVVETSTGNATWSQTLYILGMGDDSNAVEWQAE